MASRGKLMESLFMCLVSILFLANVSQVMEEPYLRRGPRQLLRSGDRHTWYFEKVNLEVPKHDKVSLKSSANNSCKGLLLQNFPTLMSSPGRENCLTPSWGQTAPASFNQINVQIILREKHGILHYTSVCIYLYLHITYIYIYIHRATRKLLLCPGSQNMENRHCPRQAFWSQHPASAHWQFFLLSLVLEMFFCEGRRGAIISTRTIERFAPKWRRTRVSKCSTSQNRSNKSKWVWRVELSLWDVGKEETSPDVYTFRTLYGRYIYDVISPMKSWTFTWNHPGKNPIRTSIITTVNYCLRTPETATNLRF